MEVQDGHWELVCNLPVVCGWAQLHQNTKDKVKMFKLMFSPTFFLIRMEKSYTCLLKEGAEHTMVNGGKRAALTPCVTTACTAGLPFLAHSPGHPFRSQQQWYLAMIYLGTSFHIHPPGFMQ